MKGAGLDAKKLSIQHKGYPGDGMPYSNFDGSKSPEESLGSNSAFYITVFIHVQWIIHDEKLMIHYLEIYH
jgi:hypothetical protein